MPSGPPGPSVWVIVVAAGAGSRFGGSKQFADLDGRPVVAWSLAAARTAAAGGVVLVLPAGDASGEGFDADHVVAGGATRSESVRAGLACVPDDAAVIVVHDGARPLASPALFAAVVEAVADGADAAIPVLPVADTLKRARPVGAGWLVEETVEREGLVTVQTPQAFSAPVLRAAHAGGGEAGDDAGLVERAGGRVVGVAGEARNLKVTVRDDLVLARAMLHP